MPKFGIAVWVDISSEHCEELRDFYSAVVGWTPQPVDCGEFEDYNMLPPDSTEPAAGVCHKTDITPVGPPVWLVYFTVRDLEASLDRVRRLGGKVLTEKRPYATGGFAFIEDPAGAVCALFQSQ